MVVEGRYVIEKLLGQGGMGAVYQALQRPIDRPVAIKLIAPGLLGAKYDLTVARFRREAAAMAKLKHPNTVRLFEFGVTADEQLFMVMELLDGCDLNHHLSSEGAMPLQAALAVANDALGSLAEAHALGIIHRDIKPANIFLSRMHDGQVMAKLMDFGVAHVGHGSNLPKLTLTGSVMGTPAYMSPEQAMGKAQDARSDIYSLGVTLFHMLAGRTPFEAASYASQLVAVVTQPVPKLSEKCQGRAFSPDLQALLERWLSKDPEGRPQNARQAQLELQALAASAAGDRTLMYNGAPPMAAAVPRPMAIPMTMLATQQPVKVRAPQTTRKPIAALGIGALVLVAGVGAVAYKMSGTGGVTATSTSAIQDADLEASEHGPAQAASANMWNDEPEPHMATGSSSANGSEQRTVLIRSTPSPVGVFRGDAEVGKTPYNLTLSAPTRLTLRAANYKPYVLDVNAQSPEDLTVKLEPAAKVPVPPAPPPPPVQSPSKPPAVQKLLTMSRPDRKQHMLQVWPPYNNIVALKAAYHSNIVDRPLYDDIEWALKRRRADMIATEKANYDRGLITQEERTRRIDYIDKAYEGR